MPPLATGLARLNGDANLGSVFGHYEALRQFPPPPAMRRTMGEIAHAGTAGRATAEAGRPVGPKLCNESLTTAPECVDITHADKVIHGKPHFKKIGNIALRVTPGSF